jgi:hypothetical protein
MVENSWKSVNRILRTARTSFDIAIGLLYQKLTLCR